MPAQERLEKAFTPQHHNDRYHKSCIEIISFPKGLYGFPSSKTFALASLKNPKYKGFYQLHSMEEPGLGFILLPINLSETSLIGKQDLLSLIDKLQIAATNCEIYAIATLEKDPNGQVAFFLNLFAPLVIDKHFKLGYQHIVEGSESRISHRLE